jgi:hypothetical protein
VSEFVGKIAAPILSAIAKEILALIRNDAELRRLWSLNAPRAQQFAAGTVTNAAVTKITIANSGNGQVFYQLAIVFDPTSGAGNFRMDGPDPTAAIGGGLAIPAGGGTLMITGADNIRNFAVIAQGAATMPFTQYLFT